MSRITTRHSVILPPTEKKRTIKFYSLDANKDELIPGWTVKFTQPRVNNGN